MKDLADMLLIGLGGAGCRLASAVAAVRPGIRTVSFDTDARALPDHAVLFGAARLNGKGTGGDVALGRQAFLDDRDTLIPHLQGVRTAIVLTALGGGTGSGAAPELLRLLKEQGIISLCFATLPFAFEGDARRKMADRFKPLLEEQADSLVGIPLDTLFDGALDLPASEAMHRAESCLAQAVTLFWRLLQTPGFIAFDDERLRGMLRKGGGAHFAVAGATGADRPRQIVDQLDRSPLLRNGAALTEARAILFGILAGHDLRLAEIGDLTTLLRTRCGEGCQFEMGTVLDPTFEGRIEVVLFTFEEWLATPSNPPAAIPLDDSRPPEITPPASGRGKRPRLPRSVPQPLIGFGQGRFRDMEPTIYKGEDLDKPTYERRAITLER